MDSNKSIGDLVRKLEQEYINGSTTISKYVNFSLSENINKIDAYLNSKHVSGERDSMGREKPFFNIVTAAVNIWYRATDIDRKDIRIKATKQSQITEAFLANAWLQEWMRRENFGAFLNDWGRTLARYGSAILKFVEADGTLHKTVCPWNRMIVDAVNFDANVKIEVLELTEAQLKSKKGYDQEIVEKLLDTLSARQTLDKQDKDNITEYVKLYEVHGQLPLSMLTGREADEKTYVQQMQVLSYVAGKEKGEFDDFILVKGKEANDPYMITHLVAEDGRTQSIGAVENLFEAQWMQNHTVKAIKDQLDLASKLIFQTSDDNFVGQNYLSSVEHGDILIHAPNQPLTELGNNAHDITALQNFGTMWKQLGNEITGISESMLGVNPPSGTAWRQTQALLQESHSLFELFIENKGLHITEMMQKYVLPFAKKKLDTTDEIAATLSEHDIKFVDSKYVPNQAVRNANKKLVNMLLTHDYRNGTPITPEMQESMIEQEKNAIQSQLSEQGTQRFFKPSDVESVTWKDYFKDMEWDLEVEVTNEGGDKNTIMQTLNTAFQTIVAMQGRAMTPEEKLVFNKILTEAGTISPLELSTTRPSNDSSTIPVTTAGGGQQVGATQ